MVKILINILAAILLALIQITLMPYLNFWGFFPNLVLLVGINLVLLGFLNQAVIYVAIAGIFLDIFNHSFGLSALAGLAIIFALQFLLTKFITEPNELVIFATCALGIFFYALIIILFSHQALHWKIFLDVLIEAIAGLIIYKIYQTKFIKNLLLKNQESLK